MIKELLNPIKKLEYLNLFVSSLLLLFSGNSVFSQCAPDVTPPTALCQDITVNLEASGSISIAPADIDNGSSDSCGAITFTLDKTGFTCNDLGANTVTLTVTDTAGNTATCTANVTVMDLVAPTITCPSPITVNQDPGTCGAVVNFATPVDGSLRINTSGTLNTGPSLATSGGTTNWSSVAYNPDLDLYYAFRAGSTGMPFRTYDGTGATIVTNTTGFDFRGMWWNPNTKQLQGNGVGTSGYRTINLDASGYATNGGTTFITGLNQPNNQSNGAYDYNNNEIIFYHNARLYTYDLNGNQLTDNAIVNFPEASNGDITTRSVGYTGIPGKEIIIYSELNARVYFIDKATATYNGDFIDMPAGAPTPNNYGFSYANGYVFLREDSSADPWVSYEIVIDDRLDNCDNTTITQTAGLVSGSTFPIGTSTVEFTAEDASGNTTTCTFDITVNDITPPTPVCQDITIQLDTSGNATITSAQIDNGSSDECGIDTLTLDNDTFNCTHIGTNNVVLTVTDNNGNSDTCNAVVTVEDNVQPNVICQNITVQLDATGNATITPAQIDNGSTDACGIATTALDLTTFDCTNIGTNNVILTVTDNNGNSDTCNAVVTVVKSKEIDILGNVVSIADGDTTPDTTDGTTFPSILPGGSVTNTYTIDNSTGTIALDITTITLGGTGAAAYTLGTLPTSVPAGGTATFNVTFSSTTPGSHDATLTIINNDCNEGTYDFAITGEVGLPAEALNFDGVDDYAIANINSASNDFTIEAWFKADSGANGYRAIAVWQKTGPNRETSIEVRGTGVIRLGQYDYDSSSWQQVYSTTNVKDDQWHHVAAVKSGNEWTLYIDGVPEGTLILNANNNASTGLTDFRIGNIQLNNGNLREHFRGEIDEVRLWNRARTCKEIVNTMGCELTGTEPDLRAYYNFNHGVAGGYNPSETTLSDQTANNFDATLTNFTLNNSVSNWISPGSGVSTTGCAVVAPEIEVSGNSTIITNNDTTPDTTDGTDFGTISSGSTQTNTFTIRNAGGTTLNVSGITITGAEFSLGALTFPIAIPANNTQDISITFTPTACGSANFTGSVSIDSDDCIDPTFTFDISGAEQDDVLPTMTCQNIIVQLDATGNATITPAQIDNGSSDACGIASTALDIATFDCTNIGTNNVVFTVTDSNGNSDTCNAVVTIQDTVLPTVVCQNITVQLDATGNATITPAQIDNGSSDACGIASTALDITTFDCTQTGTNTVTLTVTDTNTNISTCTATVTVEDNVAPVADCMDITSQLDTTGNLTLFASDINNNSTDNCNTTYYSFTRSPLVSQKLFNNNNNSRGHGQSFTATVTGFLNTIRLYVNRDYTNRSIHFYNGGSGSGTPGSVGTPDYTESGVNLTNSNGGTVWSEITLSTPFPVIAGNEYSFVIQGNTNIYYGWSNQYAGGQFLWNYGDPRCCNWGDLAFELVFDERMDFDCSHVGPNTVPLLVTDSSGNTDTCNANVTIEDNEIPTMVCQNITVQLDTAGNVTITPAQIDNGSSDACGIASTALDITTFDCTNIGTNNVVLTVTDNNGNSDTCNAVVTVQDNVLPNVICQNITAQLDATGNATITPSQIDNGSTDACGIASTALDITSFDCTNIGTNNVVLTVTDNNGNSNTCNAVVTVQDNVMPNVVCQNITVPLDATGNATITPAQIDNGSSDACGIASTTLDITTFDCTNIGTNNVILTVTDNNGNSNTCNAVVTIQDTVLPTVVCQNITVQLDAAGSATITATDLDDGSSDSCGIASYTLDTYNFNCSSIGTNSVTLTVTDTNGNSSNCTATVTIEDNILPIADIPVLLPIYEACSLTTMTPPTATDNCSNTITGVTSTVFPILVSTTITWTFDDGNGNIITQDQEVTIEDTFAPIPDNTSLEEINTVCTLNNLPAPTGSDECVGAVTATTNTLFPITQSTVVEWIYTDGANSITQNQQVTIHDSTPTNYTATAVTNGTGDRATITVNLTGSQYANYEVQLDNDPWTSAQRDGNTFTVTFTDVFIPTSGLQIVNLRNVDGCWQDSLEVYLVGYRGSFTPNGDGIHDTWNMIGLANSNPNANVTIFNRLGKLLAQITPSGAGWDGTYNGVAVPSSEYWFKVNYTEIDSNGNQVPRNISGHFSLIR